MGAKKKLAAVKALYAKAAAEMEETRGDDQYVALDTFLDELGDALNGGEPDPEPETPRYFVTGVSKDHTESVTSTVIATDEYVAKRLFLARHPFLNITHVVKE